MPRIRVHGRHRMTERVTLRKEGARTFIDTDQELIGRPVSSDLVSRNTGTWRVDVDESGIPITERQGAIMIRARKGNGRNAGLVADPARVIDPSGSDPDRGYVIPFITNANRSDREAMLIDAMNRHRRSVTRIKAGNARPGDAEMAHVARAEVVALRDSLNLTPRYVEARRVILGSYEPTHAAGAMANAMANERGSDKPSPAQAKIIAAKERAAFT